MKQDKLTVKRDLLTSLAKGFYKFGAFLQNADIKDQKNGCRKGLDY